MISHNPFADLLPAAIMQTYVVLMFLLVVGSTLLDVIHKFDCLASDHVVSCHLFS